jgi:hypothetical protein
VIRAGRLVAETSPGHARAALAGAIFEGTVDSDEDLRAIGRARTVTQAVLVEGRNRVRIHEPGGGAPDGFEPVPPTLEDAYFLMMKGGAEARLFDSPDPGPRRRHLAKRCPRRRPRWQRR